MDLNARKALIAAYYLSREPDAYKTLGLGNTGQTHRAIGAALGIPATGIKNRRDEFDPIHSNSRVGWYQRPMRPSRARIAAACASLSADALHRLVKSWVDPSLGLIPLPAQDEGEDADCVPEDGAVGGGALAAARGITGKAAEEAFRAYHSTTGLPTTGTLHDHRELGLGYDFHIESSAISAFVEVKGLAGDSGGISFTAREWKTAKLRRHGYWLVLVTGAQRSPSFHFVSDPAYSLSAALRLETVLQEKWVLSSAQVLARSSQRPEIAP